MAQQNSNLTRSNLKSATSVSALDHESSPKNDASLVLRKRQRDLKILNRLRDIHGLPRKSFRRPGMNPLNYVCTDFACIDLNRL